MCSGVYGLPSPVQFLPSWMLKFLCRWEKPETCHVVQSSFMSNYHGTGPFSYLLLAYWEERRAHALPCTQLQHPPPAPQQPLASPAAAAVTQNEWSRLRNVDTKGGMSFCWVQPHPPYPFRTHTHKYTQQCPTSPGMFKHRGVKSLIMTSFMIKAVVYMTERNTWSNFIGHVWDFVRGKKRLYFRIVWFRTTCMTVAGEWKTWRWLWCGWSWWFEMLEVGCFFSFHWFNSLPYLWKKWTQITFPTEASRN